MIRRINFYGPPGSGKSTIAPRIFSDLKKLGYNVEYTPEYIKKWAYMKKIPQGFEQLYVCAKQIHSEDVFLRHGVDLIISDSPIMMNWAYCSIYKHPIEAQINKIACEWEKQHPAIHIWLNRAHSSYSNIGRYENEEESNLRAIELKKTN